MGKFLAYMFMAAVAALVACVVFMLVFPQPSQRAFGLLLVAVLVVGVVVWTGLWRDLQRRYDPPKMLLALAALGLTFQIAFQLGFRDGAHKTETIYLTSNARLEHASGHNVRIVAPLDENVRIDDVTLRAEQDVGAALLELR